MTEDKVADLTGVVNMEDEEKPTTMVDHCYVWFEEDNQEEDKDPDKQGNLTRVLV
jgi:hypothetical protein